MTISRGTTLSSGGERFVQKNSCFLCALSLLLPIGIHASDDLYLGGDSIGIQLDYNGVMITGTYPFVVQVKPMIPAVPSSPVISW